MTLKFVIILQNLIKAYHRKSGKSKYDRKLTELDVETKRIRSRAFHGGTMEYTSGMTSQRTKSTSNFRRILCYVILIFSFLQTSGGIIIFEKRLLYKTVNVFNIN